MGAGVSPGELAALTGALLAAGFATGLLAGLLGIGGGSVLVPVLYEVFGSLGVDEAVRMHLAVGTSLATKISRRTLAPVTFSDTPSEQTAIPANAALSLHTIINARTSGVKVERLMILPTC